MKKMLLIVLSMTFMLTFTVSAFARVRVVPGVNDAQTISKTINSNQTNTNKKGIAVRKNNTKPATNAQGK